MLAIDMSRVSDIEYSALQMMIENDERAVREGVTVWLVGLNPGVLEIVRKSGLDKQLGPHRLLFNVRVAIEQYKDMNSTARPKTGPA